jgi:hypothetical protein
MTASVQARDADGEQERSGNRSIPIPGRTGTGFDEGVAG